MAKTLQSGFLTTVRVGSRTLPPAYTWSGGEVTNEAVADRAPGQQFPSAVPGLKTLTSVTVGWTFDPAIWTDAVIADLFSQVDKENTVSASRKPKDANGAVFGKGRTFVGTLTAVREPDTDSNAAERAVIELEFQPSSVS